MKSLVKVNGQVVRLIGGQGAIHSSLKAGYGPGPRLTWRQPTLTDPIIIPLVSNSDGSLATYNLSNTRDYVLVARSTVLTSGIRINGGRNICLIGAEWQNVPMPNGNPGGGIWFNDQAAGGIVHIEGCKFAGQQVDSISISQTNANVFQIQNCYTAENHGDVGYDPYGGGTWPTPTDFWPGAHPDVIQTWRGPDILRVDRFSANTVGQGFFFEHDDVVGQPVPTLHDIRNIDIRPRTDVSVSRHLLWRGDSTALPLTCTNVWLDSGGHPPIWDPDQPYRTTWNGVAFTGHNTNTYPGVTIGRPSTRFVDPAIIGRNYISPGYIS